MCLKGIDSQLLLHLLDPLTVELLVPLIWLELLLNADRRKKTGSVPAKGSPAQCVFLHSIISLHVSTNLCDSLPVCCLRSEHGLAFPCASLEPLLLTESKLLGSDQKSKWNLYSLNYTQCPGPYLEIGSVI